MPEASSPEGHSGLRDRGPRGGFGPCFTSAKEAANADVVTAASVRSPKRR
jgi:hypothetical protein